MSSYKSASTQVCVRCSVQAIVLAGGPADNALARFRAMPAVKLGEKHFGFDSLDCADSSGYLMLGHLEMPLIQADPRMLIAGSNMQLIDVPISNAIKSGINKM